MNDVNNGPSADIISQVADNGAQKRKIEEKDSLLLKDIKGRVNKNIQ
jgi:hypothetical protein